MSENIKICFIADKHNLFDDRIYWKMAVPLSRLGYNVHYLLIGNRDENGETNEVRNGSATDSFCLCGPGTRLTR